MKSFIFTTLLAMNMSKFNLHTTKSENISLILKSQSPIISCLHGKYYFSLIYVLPLVKFRGLTKIEGIMVGLVG